MKISGRYFDVYLGEAKKGAPPQVQITVSAKVSKKAVDRNLIKRRFREIIRLSQAACPDLSRAVSRERIPGNIRIIAIPGILRAKFKELKDDFMSAVAKFNNEIIN